jgi:hypothetical protein
MECNGKRPDVSFPTAAYELGLDLQRIHRAKEKGWLLDCFRRGRNWFVYRDSLQTSPLFRRSELLEKAAAKLRDPVVTPSDDNLSGTLQRLLAEGIIAPTEDRYSLQDRDRLVQAYRGEPEAAPKADVAPPEPDIPLDVGDLDDWTLRYITGEVQPSAIPDPYWDGLVCPVWYPPIDVFEYEVIARATDGQGPFLLAVRSKGFQQVDGDLQFVAHARVEIRGISATGRELPEQYARQNRHYERLRTEWEDEYWRRRHTARPSPER